MRMQWLHHCWKYFSQGKLLTYWICKYCKVHLNVKLKSFVYSENYTIRSLLVYFKNVSYCISITFFLVSTVSFTFFNMWVPHISNNIFNYSQFTFLGQIMFSNLHKFWDYFSNLYKSVCETIKCKIIDDNSK